MALIGNNPKQTFAIAHAKKRASDLTEEYFLENRTKDESDAFRHFLWAALMAKNIAPDFSKAFTDSHESCVTANSEQEMDYVNNGKGIEAFRALSRERGKVTENDLVAEALNQIEKGKLSILKHKRLK